MAKLKDFAKAYEPQQTKNIADLKECPTDVDLIERSGIDKNGEKYSFNVVIVNEEEYRIPDSVVAGLKAILEKKPTLAKFSVSKTGQGLNTKYQVIPLE